ncbi:hypothetical protein SCUCBS95973_009485 [Sporothrix curviconia]|uniref:Ankyrin repeat protein n=1 Tax=Sporothrix curviconia TaxID=1260050 RepID=A0ABP0CX08_9PEZI
MDSELPPYSPPATGAAVQVPQIILADALPPSYDAATAGDASSNNPQHDIDDLRRDPSPTAPRSSPRSFRSHLTPVSSLTSSSGEPSHARPPPSSFVSRLSALKHRRPSESTTDNPATSKNKNKNKDKDKNSIVSKAVDAAPVSLTPAQVLAVLDSVFVRHPWKRTWGPWPPNLDVALRTAALNADKPLVHALLDAGAPILYTDRYAAIKSREGSVLHAALRGAAPELADEIVGVFWGRLAANPSSFSTQDACKQVAALVDARDGQGCAPLHIAAEAGAAEAVIQLLQRGAEVDAVDNWRRTALHMAARYGRRAAAEVLVAAGADTVHLLPPPSSSEDGKDELAPMWADALRRGRAGAEQLAVLGDHRVVTELVSSIVADMGGRGAQGEYHRGDSKGDVKQPMVKPSSTTAKIVAEASSSSSSASPTLGDNMFRHGTSRPKKAPAFCAPEPFALGPAEASSIMAQQPVLHPWRTPHVPRNGSLTTTPAYGVWREGLETMQAEHQSQRSRNERDEIPEGMDL